MSRDQILTRWLSFFRHAWDHRIQWSDQYLILSHWACRLAKAISVVLTDYFNQKLMTINSSWIDQADHDHQRDRCVSNFLWFSGWRIDVLSVNVFVISDIVLIYIAKLINGLCDTDYYLFNKYREPVMFELRMYAQMIRYICTVWIKKLPS